MQLPSLIDRVHIVTSGMWHLLCNSNSEILTSIKEKQGQFRPKKFCKSYRLHVNDFRGRSQKFINFFILKKFHTAVKGKVRYNIEGVLINL